MSISFEWDPQKAALNKRKHRVTFDEAVSAFGDALSLTIPDPKHSNGEKRFILIGSSLQGRVLVVVFTYRGDNIRIITARAATHSERQSYEN